MAFWLTRLFHRKKKERTQAAEEDAQEAGQSVVRGPRYMKQMMGFNDSLEVVREARVERTKKPAPISSSSCSGRPEQRVNSVASGAEVSLQPISHGRRDSAKQMKSMNSAADALERNLSGALADIRTFRSHISLS